AAETDAFSTESAGLDRVTRNIGIGAHAHGAERLGPAHDGLQLAIVGRRGHGAELALDHAARSAVERDPVAFFQRERTHAHLFFLFIDFDFTRADHAERRRLDLARRHYGPRDQGQ